jgi:hypothetical protein
LNKTTITNKSREGKKCDSGWRSKLSWITNSQVSAWILRRKAICETKHETENEANAQSNKQAFTWGQFHQRFTRSFYMRRSQMCKMTDDLTAFFMPLGSVWVKVLLKTLMKLTPNHQLRQKKDFLKGW